MAIRGDSGRSTSAARLALIVGALHGCLVEELDEEYDGSDPTGRTVQGLSADNGLVINGALGNGIAVNGIAVNGIHGNGIAVNGIAVNGIAVNGIAINGIAANGIAANGIAANGIAANGIAINGIGVNGVGINGVGGNGYYVNGIAANGIAANGIALNGIAINALYANGIAANGVAQNGLYVAGAPLTAGGLHGKVINGTTASTAIKVGTVGGAIGALDAGQQAELRDRVLPYLAFCALPASSTGRNPAGCASDAGCVMVYDGSTASPRYYWGEKGYAPEWKNGALSTTGSDKVEGCLKQACVERGADCQKGIALNAQQEAQTETLFRYLVSCALPAYTGVQPVTASSCGASPGCATIKSSNGTAKFYTGAMGLAPAWRNGPLDAVGRQRVSACLGARTNGNGEPVVISMRGMGLSVGPTEKAQFSRREGAFYGDLFAATPSLRTCMVDGGGTAGRVCANGQCGFTYDGKCGLPTVCSAADAEGLYTSCAGYGEVLNTFLPFKSIAEAGNEHSCVLTADERVSCWGRNEADVGRLGDGTSADRLTPAPQLLPAGVKIAQLSLGHENGCSRAVDGRVFCNGAGLAAQLGNGTGPFAPFSSNTDSGPGASNVPVQAFGLTRAVDLSLGKEPYAYYSFACATQADASLWCWGDNRKAQLGLGSTVGAVNVPTRTGLTGVVQVSAGGQGACALKGDGTLWCWGTNWNGEVGDGTTTVRRAPVQVTSLGNQVIDLSTGKLHACAVKADRSVWCWGNNDFGQVGNGSKKRALLPVQVATGGLRLAAGEHGTCLLKTDGKVFCWGWNNWGQLGDGTMTDRTTPVAVVGLPGTIVDLRLESSSVFAVRSDRSIWAWGKNGHGQLGNGTTTNQSRPVRMNRFIASDGVCQPGESTVESAECRKAEECLNGFDDDGDGQADCGDADCAVDAAC